MDSEKQEFTIVRSFWFIVTDFGNTTYYLHRYDHKLNAAYWTKNYENATAFMNNERATSYKTSYFDNRRETCIIEHEVEV